MPDQNQTKTLIIERAKKLFAAQGYTQTSMRDIAQAARLSTGPLYFHFKDKKNILEAILTEAYETFGKAITTLPAQAETALSQIELVLAEYLELYQRENIYFEICNHLTLSGENLATNANQLISALEKRTTHHLQQIITQGVASGELRECDPQNIAQALQAMIQGFTDSRENIPTPNIIKEILSLLKA
jgi:AcrR family transcriptional regulator